LVIPSIEFFRSGEAGVIVEVASSQKGVRKRKKGSRDETRLTPPCRTGH
jgi:hypothetical protein